MSIKIIEQEIKNSKEEKVLKTLHKCIENYKKNPIVLGCNYHTKWQSKKAMRFVLRRIKGSQAELYTRRTKKRFWTNIEDLVFINTTTNKRKANINE